MSEHPDPAGPTAGLIWPAPPADPPPGGAVASTGPRLLRGLLPYLVWEAVLLVAVLLLIFVFAPDGGSWFHEPRIWVPIAGAGLVASALALSLRTATPNLAVVSVAVAAAAGDSWLLSRGWAPLQAVLVVLAASLVLGLLLGLIVGLTSLPAWAVSLFGIAGLTMLMTVVASSAFPFEDGPTPRPEPPGGGAWWFGLFALISIGGGLCWLIAPVRRAFSANRHRGEATASTRGRLVGALAGLGVSSLLAAAGGLLLARELGFAGYAPFGFGLPVEYLLLALVAVLLGGTSLFGGRGGVAGTVLGVLLLAGVYQVVAHSLKNENQIWLAELPIAGGLLLGLLVSWLLDLISRRLEGPAKVAE